MRRRQWDTTLYELAEDQAGYFTAAQAREAGLHQVRLVQLHQLLHAARCVVERDALQFPEHCPPAALQRPGFAARHVPCAGALGRARAPHVAPERRARVPAQTRRDGRAAAA